MIDLSQKTEVHVATAVKLNKNQAIALKKILVSKLAAPVTIVNTVDPNLIGGLRLQVEGRLFDKTIRKQLDQIKETLQAKEKK